MKPSDRECNPEAYDAVLAWCRKGRGNELGMTARPCMRVTVSGECIVVDNSRFSSPVMARGPHWAGVLLELLSKE